MSEKTKLFLARVRRLIREAENADELERRLVEEIEKEFPARADGGD